MVTKPAVTCVDQLDARTRRQLWRWIRLSERRAIPISDYTVVNLKEIDDSAGDSAALEAHFGRKHLGSEHLGVSHFRAGPGFRSEKGDSHRKQEEVYIVVAGSGPIKLNDKIIELGPWYVVRVAPATVRALEAGPNGLEFIAVGTDRPEGGDVADRELRGRAGARKARSRTWCRKRRGSRSGSSRRSRDHPVAYSTHHEITQHGSVSA